MLLDATEGENTDNRQIILIITVYTLTFTSNVLKTIAVIKMFKT